VEASTEFFIHLYFIAENNDLFMQSSHGLLFLSRCPAGHTKKKSDNLITTGKLSSLHASITLGDNLL
jgi:hypothetical protein